MLLTRNKRRLSVTPQGKGNPREYKASDQNKLLGNGGNIFCWCQWLVKSAPFHWAFSLSYDALTSSFFTPAAWGQFCASVCHQSALCTSARGTCAAVAPGWRQTQRFLLGESATRRLSRPEPPEGRPAELLLSAKNRALGGAERGPLGSPLEAGFVHPSTLYLSIVCWFFNNIIDLPIYFWLCCVFIASRGLFFSCKEQRLLTLCCSTWASHWGSFSCCRAQALGRTGFSSFSTQVQELWLPSLCRTQAQ